MDCKTARTLLEMGRPLAADLDVTETEALGSHLADCLDCSAINNTEHKLDDHIGRAMRAVPIPDGLRDRISLRLAAQGRTSRRRSFAKYAVAATILLAVLGWAFWPRPLIRIDLEGQRAAAENLPRSAGEVEEHFEKKYKVRLKAPVQFNYDLLAYCGMGEIQGHLVPMLEFKNGPAYGHVYILDARKFDLQALQGADRNSGRLIFEFAPDDPFGYIFEWIGGIPDMFKSRESFPAT